MSLCIQCVSLIKGNSIFTVYVMDLQFTKNQVGRLSLLQEGYRYNFEKTNKSGSTLWRCANRSCCSSTITLDQSKTKVLRSSDKNPHTCFPDLNRNRILLAIEKTKSDVCVNFDPIQKIYEGNIEHLKLDCCVPSFLSVKDTLYRARKKFLNTDRLIFSNIQEVYVPSGLAKKFLICEDGDIEKILVFSTPLAKKHIKGKPGRFYGDGTFRCVPSPFYQLYTIHFDLGSTIESVNVKPIIYAMLPNKSEITYTRFFEILKEKLKVEMTDFKCDYESAVINAVQTVYPQCKVTGCYYHFQKAIWRKYKQLKIQGHGGRKMVRWTTHLPLLPSHLIKEGWRVILNNVPELTNPIMEFKIYFESQWLRKVSAEILSCAHQLHRTTNVLEGWHRRLNARIPKKPTFFSFVHKLRKEGKHFNFQIQRCLFHPLKKNRKNCDIQFDQKLEKHVCQLEANEITIIEYLQKTVYMRLKFN